MTAYYNEHDKYAAAWLRNLIAAGHIAPGDVDDRSIEDVRPDDLAGYRQCHFFAGIGVWSYALRRAGVADDAPVWTASCPCQPFSQAGDGDGMDDERHLWPAFFHLVRERRPAKILGEQVASKDAEPWLDLVCDDLGSLGYACGAVAFPSAGVGAPHIRDRLYWVADACRAGSQKQRGRRLKSSGSAAHRWLGDLADTAEPGWDEQSQRDGGTHGGQAAESGRLRAAGLLGNAGNAGNEGLAQRQRFPGIPGRPAGADERQAAVGAGIHAGELAHADGRNARAEGLQRSGQHGQQPQDGGACMLGYAERERPQGRGDTGGGEGMGQPWAQPAGARADGNAGPVNGFWRAADWLLCRDGRWRPVEPGTQPLAHGAASRVGRLRAYGNALCAPAAETFIRSVMESMP